MKKGAIIHGGDKWKNFWMRLRAAYATGCVGGYEFVQLCDSAATELQIFSDNADGDARLMRICSDFLVRQGEGGVWIADVYMPDDENSLPISALVRPVRMQNRIVGQLPPSLVCDMRAEWFAARWAFFCACPSAADAEKYAQQARRGLPSKALRRGLLQAYVVGGDDSGQWTLAVRGFHPEMMQRLRALLTET